MMISIFLDLNISDILLRKHRGWSHIIKGFTHVENDIKDQLIMKLKYKSESTIQIRIYVLYGIEKYYFFAKLWQYQNVQYFKIILTLPDLGGGVYYNAPFFLLLAHAP